MVNKDAHCNNNECQATGNLAHYYKHLNLSSDKVSDLLRN
jgi:hypothetical protein